MTSLGKRDHSLIWPERRLQHPSVVLSTPWKRPERICCVPRILGLHTHDGSARLRDIRERSPSRPAGSAVVLSRQFVFAGVTRSRWILRKMSSAMRMIDELIVASSIPIVVSERTTHL